MSPKTARENPSWISSRNDGDPRRRPPLRGSGEVFVSRLTLRSNGGSFTLEKGEQILLPFRNETPRNQTMPEKDSSTKKETGEASIAEAEKHFQSSKAHAEEAARELRLAAAEKAKELREAALQAKEEYQKLVREHAEQFQTEATEKAHQYRDLAGESFSEAQEKIEDYQKKGEDYVRENPLKSVLLALGVGFIIAKIFRS